MSPSAILRYQLLLSVLVLCYHMFMLTSYECLRCSDKAKVKVGVFQWFLIPSINLVSVLFLMVSFGREHSMYLQFFYLQCIKNVHTIKMQRIYIVQLIISFCFQTFFQYFSRLWPFLSLTYLPLLCMWKNVKKAEELKSSLFLMCKFGFFFDNVHLKIPIIFFFF